VPGEAVDEIRDRHVECATDLHHGVELWDSLAPLHHPDLRAVDRSEEPKLFLTDSRRSASAD
jgi:hypothetical protein